MQRTLHSTTGEPYAIGVCLHAACKLASRGRSGSELVRRGGLAARRRPGRVRSGLAHGQPARQVGLPVSPVGPPLPGMGRVFVSYAGDLNNVWAHWEDGKRYVFFSGTYGEALLWALSQPAKEHHVPVPRSRDTVEVRPHRARSE